MSSNPLPCSADIADIAASLGFNRVGAADVAPVDPADAAIYDDWTARGMHADMDYMLRNADVRNNPALLLEGAQSVIVCAMSYYHPDQFDRHAPAIAAYAHGRDYHKVVRQRLKQLAAHIEERYGGATRCCVDTAPLRERYWAVKAGVGFIGRNGCLIVPQVGSWCFLGAILTTVRFAADKPSTGDCAACGACLKACPAKALRLDRTVDARRCISYLTIEHRGDLPEGARLHGCIYGCDACQRVCPHNLSPAVTAVEEFCWRPELRAMTRDDFATITDERYDRLTAGSAMRRASAAALRRNATAD